MTVNTLSITNGPYAGNDVTSAFDYTFKINDNAEVSVYETDNLGNTTLLTLTTDYTVSGVLADAGGSITRVAGPLPTGYTWNIRANYIPTQETAFASQGGFFPDIHELSFDKLTYLMQQVLDFLSRSVKLKDYDELGDMTLPVKADRLGNTLAFDAVTGFPVVGPSVGAISSAAANAAATAADKIACDADAAATAADRVQTGLDAASAAASAAEAAAVLNAMVYQGTWDASTNTPPLTSGVGTQGYYYKVSVAGTTNLDGHASWSVDDAAIFNGTTWDILQGGITNGEIVAALGYTPLDSANITTTGTTTATLRGGASDVALQKDGADFLTNDGSKITAALPMVVPAATATGEAMNFDQTFQAASTGSIGYSATTTLNLSTSLPAWVKKFRVSMSNISTVGTSGIAIQLSTGGAFVITGYDSVYNIANTTTPTAASNGVFWNNGNAANYSSGHIDFTLQDEVNFVYEFSGTLTLQRSGVPNLVTIAGSIALGGIADGVRLASADNFDSGAATLIYEG